MAWTRSTSETVSSYAPPVGPHHIALLGMSASSSDRRAKTLKIREILGGSEFEVEVKRLAIAGFTGRSLAEVSKHVEELRSSGIEAPQRIPATYLVDPNLLTIASSISVEGDHTSGEIEPVVVRADGMWFLVAGSDHTDRALEATSIQASKEACPKVISSECFPVEAIDDWDRIELRSWLDDDADSLYQEGTLSQLLPLESILSSVVERWGSIENGDAVFLGTIPVRQGRMQPSDSFAGEIQLGSVGKSLSVTYRVQKADGEGRQS